MTQNHIDHQNKHHESIGQMVKFALFSVSAGAIQLASFTIFFEIVKWIYWPAYLSALVLSVLWNFTLNRKFTFKAANHVPTAMLKVALFYAIFTPASTYWGDYLTKVGWNEYLILGITMVTNLITEFIYTKYIVYRHAVNTAVIKEK